MTVFWNLFTIDLVQLVLFHRLPEISLMAKNENFNDITQISFIVCNKAILPCLMGTNTIHRYRVLPCNSMHSHYIQQGLQTGDLIREFGSVSSNNFKSLQDIAVVVQHSKDVCLWFNEYSFFNIIM